MKKYLNKQFAKRLMILGFILYAVGYVINAVAVYNILSDDCVHGTNACTFTTEQIVGKFAIVAVAYPGIVIFLIGLVLLLIVLVRQKKQ